MSAPRRKAKAIATRTASTGTVNATGGRRNADVIDSLAAMTMPEAITVTQDGASPPTVIVAMADAGESIPDARIKVALHHGRRMSATTRRALRASRGASIAEEATVTVPANRRHAAVTGFPSSGPHPFARAVVVASITTGAKIADGRHIVDGRSNAGIATAAPTATGVADATPQREAALTIGAAMARAGRTVTGLTAGVATARTSRNAEYKDTVRDFRRQRGRARRAKYVASRISLRLEADVRRLVSGSLDLQGWPPPAATR